MNLANQMNYQTIFMIKGKAIKSKIFNKIFSVGIVLLLQASSLLSFGQVLPDKPNPARLVNDFAGMLGADASERLERKLVNFDDSTSNQIAVVTVDSLSGDDISDFAIKLFQKWKIGAAKKNNGVLVLISKPDRKVWITVGYGLESVITDALSRRFIDQDIIPNFKNGQYYEGIDLATTHLMQLAKGEYHEARPKLSRGSGSNLVFVLILVMILIFIFTRGGGGASQIGRNGSSSPLWFFLGAMMNSGNGSSWGGNNSDSGFGNGGGGGFGGFGGGDTGGGGAGGSW